MARFTVKFVGYQKPASIHNQAAEKFGEALKDRLGEEVDFQLTGDVTRLGYAQFDRPELVASGMFSMWYQSTSYFVSSGVPGFGVLDLPYLFSSHEHAYRALDEELGRRLIRSAEDNSPFSVLRFWDNGFRHISNSVRPIRTPGDCVGLRIRTLTSPLHGEVFATLGMHPDVMDIATLLDRSRAGTVDAQDNPLTNIFNFGIQKLQPHITMTGHIWGGAVLSVNREVFESWPPHMRAAIREAADIATAYQRKLAAAEDEQILSTVEPGEVDIVQLTAGERHAFVAAVQPVIDRHRDEYADLLKLIDAAR